MISNTNFIIKKECENEFIDFNIEFMRIDKIDCTDYGGQWYSIKSILDLTKCDEDEAELFLNFLEESYTSISAVANSQSSSTELHKDDNNVFYLNTIFIDKNNDFENSFDKDIIDSLISDSILELEFAISEIGSYSAYNEFNDNLTSGDLKSELMEKYNIEINHKTESAEEQALEEAILDECTNIEALEDKIIMHDINDEFEITILEKFNIMRRTLELANN